MLLDYDGTLCPIAGRPDLALLSSETCKSLLTLSRKQGFSVGIVSGRGLADVADMVALPDLIYAGNHGLEMRGPDLEFMHPEALALKPDMDALLDKLEESLSGYEGVLVEGKGLTLSVHYRLTPEACRRPKSLPVLTKYWVK